jgi:hypothetical protein
LNEKDGAMDIEKQTSPSIKIIGSLIEKISGGPDW